MRLGLHRHGAVPVVHRRPQGPARTSVGLEGFMLSKADEEHAQRFIRGEIALAEFVKVRNDSAHER
ncbi:chromosome segregation protein ParM [Verminephrobacter aporrectodeae subsp. tuberculatae]|nr:chromosome segregation protein ParM [Verminephrobacter aporrectodeae subsp. tuberculatae]